MLRISEGGHVWKLHKLAKSNVISFLNYFQPENLGLYHGFFFRGDRYLDKHVQMYL